MKLPDGHCSSCVSFEQLDNPSPIGYCRLHGTEQDQESWCPMYQVRKDEIDQIPSSSLEDKWYREEQINPLTRRHYDTEEADDTPEVTCGACWWCRPPITLDGTFFCSRLGATTKLNETEECFTPLQYTDE